MHPIPMAEVIEEDKEDDAFQRVTERPLEEEEHEDDVIAPIPPPDRRRLRTATASPRVAETFREAAARQTGPKQMRYYMDVFLYMFSGVILILMMEQVLQLGVRLQS